jgi:hypothetical protein
MYIEHYGTMTVKNHLTGDYALVEFKKRGWGNKGAFEFEGFAFTANKEKKYRLWGKWIESMSVKNLQTGVEEKIW